MSSATCDSTIPEHHEARLFDRAARPRQRACADREKRAPRESVRVEVRLRERQEKRGQQFAQDVRRERRKQ